MKESFEDIQESKPASVDNKEIDDLDLEERPSSLKEKLNEVIDDPEVIDHLANGEKLYRVLSIRYRREAREKLTSLGYEDGEVNEVLDGKRDSLEGIDNKDFKHCKTVNEALDLLLQADLYRVRRQIHERRISMEIAHMKHAQEEVWDTSEYKDNILDSVARADMESRVSLLMDTKMGRIARRGGEVARDTAKTTKNSVENAKDSILYSAQDSLDDVLYSVTNMLSDAKWRSSELVSDVMWKLFKKV